MRLLRYFFSVVLASLIFLSTTFVQAQSSPRSAAWDEGLVRYVIEACFEAGSKEQAALLSKSHRYLKALSLGAAIEVAELERLADEGMSEAKLTKKLSSDQCKNSRSTTLKLLQDRDLRIGSIVN